jgi:hypothetical protein
MTYRPFIVSVLILATTVVVQAAEILKVQDNAELSAAREARVDLLSTSNGFEASGASELSESRLPVVGVLPSELGAVFAQDGTGFESAPKIPANFRESGLKTIPALTPNKLEYSISYQHIADGLDAVCIGKRLINRLFIKQPPEFGGQGGGQSSPERDDELHVAHAEQTRYGLPYRCDVYCSDLKTSAYCRNNSYAEKMLGKALLLAPGRPD